MQPHIVHVSSPYELVVELGRREVTSVWWLRYCNGTPGLEALVAPNRVIRLELAEPDEPVAAE